MKKIMVTYEEGMSTILDCYRQGHTITFSVKEKVKPQVNQDNGYVFDSRKILTV